MLNVHKVERVFGGKNISIETGKVAKQADAAVWVQCGETIVLVSVVSAKPRNEEIDYFPLSVEYREKISAAGKFPGGFIKREGRPSTKESLTSRIIDRPIRPLFPDGYFDEVQIIASVLSADQENEPDILALIGASAALTISKIPFIGPIGGCRLGRVDDQFIVNPTYEQFEKSDLNLLLGGTKQAINMIEVESKELPEETMAEAIRTAHKTIVEVCEMIEELRQKCGVEKEFTVVELDNELYSEIKQQISEKLYQLKQIINKKERQTAVTTLFDELAEKYCKAEPGREAAHCERLMLKRVFEKIEKETVRKLILNGKRLDGRGYEDIRPISCEVGILPRTHGSALFTRGETQALASVTLGTVRDAQIIDGLTAEYDQKFMLHYNFPPFSVGEVKPMRGPGRREIGHGALAEKALEQGKPPFDEFPYTVRLVSDILESNGSSSMASVCAGSLAMMDAGIPVKKPIAGISVGLISEGDKHVLLTDIIGDEDHFGDMDFKVAGTADGITAIQLDIKIEGLADKIVIEALQRAKQARLKILDIMSKTIDRPRPEMSKYAPKLITIEIDPEYIGKVIGPGGKMIKSIQEQTGAVIEIEEDGTIYISCAGGDGHIKAREIIEAMTTPPTVGRIYPSAKVVSAKDFGVFVEFVPGIEGLCHISELAEGYIKNVDEVCKVGDVIPVKLLLIDEQGRFKLSRKAALIEMRKQQADTKS